MKLLLGISGGIAAHKACELASLAAKRDHEVRVLMTANAARFVGPLSLEGLTGTAPLVGQDHLSSGSAMTHIEWAKWADVACIAPMTANVLAKLAMGLADDALTTVLMALPSTVPVVLGPAMNTEMWLNPVVRRNVQWIDDLARYTWVDPVTKRLACGDVGPGGLADPADLLSACEMALANPANITAI